MASETSYTRELSRTEEGGYLARTFGPPSGASVRASQAMRRTIFPFVGLWRPTRRGITLARRFFDPPLPLPPLRGTRLQQRWLGGVKVEWTVAPRAQQAGDQERVILYLHGGGFVFGSPRTHRNIVSRLSHVTATPVASVDYRMAPEASLAASQHDALAAYRALLEAGHPAETIVLAGDSAGGGLAAYVALRAAELGLPRPAALILLSPWLDLGPGGQSRTANLSTEFFIAGDVLERIARVLVPDADRRAAWPASPAAAPDALLRGLPPTLIQIGDGEVLADDAVSFAERIGAVGRIAELQIFQGQGHVVAMWANTPESRRALREIAGWLTDALPTDRAPATPTPEEVGEAADAQRGSDLRPEIFPG